MKPFASSIATASASPMARHMVVDVVGAGASSLASPQSGRMSGTSAAFASVDSGLKVIATRGIFSRWQ
ncbi:MAG: hypothetical protein FD124_818 [Alphaproteobacteria bacterium]|nr:MAG: hypothetical protein FD124_818 [Alphaproteobacteria bacterium]